MKILIRLCAYLSIGALGIAAAEVYGFGWAIVSVAPSAFLTGFGVADFIEVLEL